MSRVIYLGHLNPNRSRSGVHFRYLKCVKPNNTFFMKIDTPFWRNIRVIKNLKRFYDKKNDILVVTSPSNMFVIYIKLFTRFKVVMDAGWPLSDNTDLRNKSIFKKIKIFLIDYVAFSISNIVLVESLEQKKQVLAKFVIHKNASRIKVLRTGFNEIDFLYQLKNEKRGNLALDEVETKKYSMVVFFRGKQNIESGIDKIFVLAKKNLDILFLVASQNIRNSVKLPNLIIERKFLNWKELLSYYDKADLILGQISDDKRLERTIAHKVYESAYFGKAYLTTNSKSLNEIFVANYDYINSGNSSVEEIDAIFNYYKRNRNVLPTIGKKMENSYKKNCSQESIAIEFQKIIDDLKRNKL